MEQNSPYDSSTFSDFFLHILIDNPPVLYYNNTSSTHFFHNFSDTGECLYDS